MNQSWQLGGGSIRVTNVDLEIAAKNRVLLRPHLLFMELHDHSNKAGLYFSGLGSHAKERLYPQFPTTFLMEGCPHLSFSSHKACGIRISAAQP
jgi:hypothetical protein